MYYKVYVLYSYKHQKTYLGFTSNLRNRLIHHNQKGVKGWSIRYRPWTLVHLELFSTKSEAMSRERYLKSGIGRKFLYQTILPLYL
jgi:putative endonuclease